MLVLWPNNKLSKYCRYLILLLGKLKLGSHCKAIEPTLCLVACTCYLICLTKQTITEFINPVVFWGAHSAQLFKRAGWLPSSQTYRLGTSAVSMAMSNKLVNYREYLLYMHSFPTCSVRKKSQGVDNSLPHVSSVQSCKHIRFCYCLFYTIILRHISSGDALHNLLYTLCDTIFRYFLNFSSAIIIIVYWLASLVYMCICIHVFTL